VSAKQRAQLERLHAHNRALRRDPIKGPAWEAKLRAGQMARYGPEILTLEELLNRYVEKEPSTGCWIWRGSRKPNGYGRLTRPFGEYFNRNRHPEAHRVVYEATGHLLLPDYDLHHRCYVRACVNPDHLEPLTRSDHMRLSAMNRQRRHEEDEACARSRVVADLVCLCGRTRGVFAAACCEEAERELKAEAR
jgi:hypothetical protein